MYGVPNTLPLQRFVGDALFQISIGVDGVHFHFGKAGTISVEGFWELHDGKGALIDKAEENAKRQRYRVHHILNEDVADYVINAPRSFTLTFKNGHKLTIYDNTPKYEAFSIQPDGIVV